MPSEADVANDYREVSVRLGAICQRLNLPFIDGREVLRGPGLKNAYFPIDGHMTFKGNDALAGAIAARLAAHDRSPSGRPTSATDHLGRKEDSPAIR